MDPQPEAAMWIDDLHQLTAVRELIAGCLSAEQDDTRLDAAVVISELVTNAFEHGEAPSVGVELRLADARLHGVVISQSHDDPGTFEPTPVLPAPDDPRGRGLVIVRALSSEYEVHVVDGYRRDHVVFELAAPTPD